MNMDDHPMDLAAELRAEVGDGALAEAALRSAKCNLTGDHFAAEIWDAVAMVLASEPWKITKPQR